MIESSLFTSPAKATPLSIIFGDWCLEPGSQGLQLPWEMDLERVALEALGSELRSPKVAQDPRRG